MEMFNHENQSTFNVELKTPTRRWKENMMEKTCLINGEMTTSFSKEGSAVPGQSYFRW